MSADVDVSPGQAASRSVWSRLSAAARWLLQRDLQGGSPWDERWSSCGPLPGDERPPHHTVPVGSPPPPR